MKKTNLLRLSVLGMALLALSVSACAGAPPPVEETPPPPPASLPPPPPRPAPEPPAPEPEPPLAPTGPEVSVTFSTEYFSPDGDGVEDDLLVSIDARSGSELTGWRIEIREPSSNLLFSEWSGEGAPPSQIEWDGRSAKGELVQSASNYPFNITVTDAEGQSAAFPGIIQVDVLVIREPGDILRVQVPSIVFGPNSGGFDGVAEDIMANNDWILRRIAQVLNTFISYKVKVEGHANPTAATAAARDREQRLELQPLSEARAKTVVDYLVNLGVARNRLTPYGIGGARPVAALEDRDNWWKNRRVEFILEK